MLGKKLTIEQVKQMEDGDLLYYSIAPNIEKCFLAKIKYDEPLKENGIFQFIGDNHFMHMTSFSSLNSIYLKDYRFYEYIPDEQINQENNQDNKIDYNKHYKGWKIFKFVDDGILKEGDIIKYNNNDNDFNCDMLIIVSDTKTLRLYIDNKETKEVPSSYFNSAINNAYFTIQQKPLTFQEILDEKYNGKKFRIEHPTLQDEYNITFENDSLNRILNLLTERVENDKILRQILNEAKFYVED